MVLLLLLTGLETDLRLLRNLGRAALIASLMGMVFPFATGFGLGLLTPDAYLAQPDRRILFSFFLATAMAISAMPVIAKILMDLDLTKRNIGVVILSAGVVDDTAGWLVLSLIAGVASHGHVRLGQMAVHPGADGGRSWRSRAFVLYPTARWLLAAITRRARTPDSDLVFLLVVTLACGAATEWIGIHAVFGAFIAGAMFRQVPELKRRDGAQAGVVRVPGPGADLLRHRRPEGEPVVAGRRRHAGGGADHRLPGQAGRRAPWAACGAGCASGRACPSPWP